MGSPLKLKPIDRTGQATSRLNAALGIYRDTILPEAQNPEKQILYWIDHSRDELSDRFRCFALMQETRVVGYLQYSHFSEEDILFFEYLCLKEAHRSGLGQSEALAAIEALLDLGVYDGAISYPADLMVRLPGNRKAVTATELRTILRCIYFKHYLRWDRPFLDADRFAERERLINDLYLSQISKIDPNGTFGTRGDDKRSNLILRGGAPAGLWSVAERLFGPKFFRVAVSLILVTVLEHFQTSDWLLIPDLIAGLMLFSAAEDTPDARKLLLALVGKLSAFWRRT